MIEEKISIVEQTPNTTNSIKTSTQPIQKTTNYLEGFIANSWNGGFLRPITFKKIFAGEIIENYQIKGIIRMLTPKVPTAQKVKTIFKCFFVPDSRIWDNANKYYAQKGSETTTKITKVPSTTSATNITSLQKFKTTPEEQNFWTSVTNTTLWRDSFTSGYYPRAFQGQSFIQNWSFPFTNIDIRPLRGYKAIYNDFLRHKVYDTELQEYKTDTLTDNEMKTIIPLSKIEPNITNKHFPKLWNDFIQRGKKQDSYYTNYRTSLEGMKTTIDPMYKDLQEHTEWQKLIAESRKQASNEQKRDIDIIQELRGSKPITDGQVQFLSMQTVGHNYTQVSQTSANTNNQITDEYQQLGATGAFSYTEFNINMLNYHEFKEDGYLHIIAQTTADTIFETAIDRTLLNINTTDEYRPELKELKDDVLKTRELSFITSNDINDKAIGFKRKWSEHFKLPNTINGDLTTEPIWNINIPDSFDDQNLPVTLSNNYLTKKEFQMFEITNSHHQAQTYNDKQQEEKWYNKKIWKDYTDLLINKNQAIELPLNQIFNPDPEDYNKQTDIWIQSQNQIFMLGSTNCITQLPLDENIKNDFKKIAEV